MALSEVQKTVLSLTSSALFDQPCELSEDIDWSAVKKEATEQAVFPLIYKRAYPKLPADEKKIWDEQYFYCVEKNLRVTAEHAEAGSLMEKNSIPYVVLKGCASAGFYPHPALRSMGDVDLLLASDGFAAAEKAVGEAGFVPDHRDQKHLVFRREPNSLWELHNCVNGIPAGDAGKACEDLLSDIISTAADYQTDFGMFRIPDAFHHGLVLLLHTASHLTKEGVGLRHLCDWAVFASGFSEESFCEIFREKLMLCGLWRFAQILTLVSEKYLGAPFCPWAGEAEDTLLLLLIEDILNGGNFGTKDRDRYRQIKYISDRDRKTVDDSGILLQLWRTINNKAAREKKNRLSVIKDYIRLLAGGKRKPDTGNTLRRARMRKKLYSTFHLFETENR